MSLSSQPVGPLCPWNYSKLYVFYNYVLWLCFAVTLQLLKDIREDYLQEYNWILEIVYKLWCLCRLLEEQETKKGKERKFRDAEKRARGWASQATAVGISIVALTRHCRRKSTVHSTSTQRKCLPLWKDSIYKTLSCSTKTHHIFAGEMYIVEPIYYPKKRFSFFLLWTLFVISEVFDFPIVFSRYTVDLL